VQAESGQHEAPLTGTHRPDVTAADQAYRSQRLELHVLPLKNAIFHIAMWRRPVVQVPGWALLTVGLLLLALVWWPLVSNRIVADRIIDPRTGDEPFHRPRLVVGAVRWSLPVILLCAVLITIVLPNSSR